MQASKPKRLLGYIRISDPSKQGDGYSLDTQEERLRGFCSLYGHELVDIMAEGESAKNVHARPVFKQALQAVLKSDDIDGILVLKIDRFSRDEADAHLVKRAFDKHKKYILCTNEPIDTSQQYGDVIFSLLVSMAASEYKTIVTRFQDGRKTAIAKGRDLTSVPRYGYKKEGTGRGAQVVADEYEQDMLKSVAGQIAAGRNNKQIACRLNQREVKTRSGRPWTAAMINKLRNRMEDKIKTG